MADAASKPVWFITGCSTGFGRELSTILLKRGYRAVVTARDKAKVADIVAGHDKNGLALALDVDKQGQIDAAVKAAEARFGRIDVLVNNAGYGYLAAVEEGDDADVRAMFDTNFFGLAAMTRAVLPIMRAQKSGAIVNISSIGGFIGFPGSGYYAATKFAVEGLSEALSKEVAPLGIKVIIVEPGPFRTDWAGRSLKTPKKPVDAYAETAIARRRRFKASAARKSAIPFARPKRSSPRLRRRTLRFACRSAPSPMRRWGRRSRPSARSTIRSRRWRAAPTIQRADDSASRAAAFALIARPWRKGIQTFPEGNPSFFGRKSKENRKEIQAFVFRGSSLFKDLRRPPTAFFIFEAAYGAGGGTAARPCSFSSSRLSLLLSSFLVLRSYEASEGLAPFQIADAWRRLPDLAAAEPRARKGNPGVQSIPGS